MKRNIQRASSIWDPLDLWCFVVKCRHTNSSWLNQHLDNPPFSVGGGSKWPVPGVCLVSRKWLCRPWFSQESHFHSHRTKQHQSKMSHRVDKREAAYFPDSAPRECRSSLWTPWCWWAWGLKYMRASLTLTYAFLHFNQTNWESCTLPAWEVKSRKGRQKVQQH